VFIYVFRQVFSRLIRLVKGKSHKLGYYHKEKAKNEFPLKKLALYSPVSHIKSKAYFVSLFLATTLSFMHDWSCHSILSRSQVPLYEKYITVIYALGLTHEENAV